MDLCSAEKGFLLTETGLALKTESDHKVMDLLELSLKSQSCIWKK